VICDLEPSLPGANRLPRDLHSSVAMRERPTPWGQERPVFPLSTPPIKEMRDRAMTLKQLRELREFAKRLCVARLLKYPQSARNDALEVSGKPVRWTQLTPHEITSEIIKRVIPQEHSCSWVELVSNGRRQERVFFCSHYWGESFRNFMGTIEHHALANRVHQSESYWICIFANNQWTVELGDMLAESPFYNALKGARMTIAFMDKKSLLFQRLWCVYEMKNTFLLEQDLECWTPLGRVGSALVSSGPVVQALQMLDTAQAQASDHVDRRQILNHIAGIEELRGILYEQQSGVKRLDPSLPVGVHERQVVDGHRQHFDYLNSLIMQTTLRTLSSEGLPSISESTRRCEIQDPALRAISLSQLRQLAQLIQGELAKHDFRDDSLSAQELKQLYGCQDNRITWDWFNMGHLTRFIVRPLTKEQTHSYVETVAEHEQAPTFFTMCARNTPFQEFMEAIEWHAEARAYPDTTTFWVPSLAYNRDDLVHDGDESEYGEDIWDLPPARVIKDYAIGSLMVVSRFVAAVQELRTMVWDYYGNLFGKSSCILCWSGVIATGRPFSEGSWESGDFDPRIAERILDFDVYSTNSEPCRSKERDLMLHIIAGSPKEQWGTAPPRRCKGYDRLNQRFRSKVAGPILRAAAEDGDVRKIRRVLSACPGLRLSSSSLKGLLGDTALHAAAGAGHCEVLRLLIRERADINAQDFEGETPLHMAALTGQAEAAKVLIQSHADHELESFNMETPLQVAQQNPAYFLDVDTAKVAALLMAEEATVLSSDQPRQCRSCLCV